MYLLLTFPGIISTVMPSAWGMTSISQNMMEPSSSGNRSIGCGGGINHHVIDRLGMRIPTNSDRRTWSVIWHASSGVWQILKKLCSALSSLNSENKRQVGNSLWNICTRSSNDKQERALIWLQSLVENLHPYRGTAYWNALLITQNSSYLANTFLPVS